MAVGGIRRVAAQSAALICGVTASAVAVGYLTLEDQRLAVLATAAVVLLGIVARNLAILAIIAVAGVWMVSRAPVLDVSYTDLLIAGAGVAALTAGVGRSLHPAARTVLGAFAFFLWTLTITLAYNHDVRSDFEWFHRIALVAGAILAGAWLVRARLHHLALRAILVVTVLVSIAAVADSITSGFAPAYPAGYHKNFVGSITATVLLVLIAAPGEFQLPRGLLRFASAATASGLLASQSRGAMIALGVGVFVWWIRQPSPQGDVRRRRAIVLLFAAALTTVALLSVRKDLQAQAHGRTFNSLTERIYVAQSTRELWSEHLYTGVGLRYFKTPAYAGYQAPNDVVNEALAEAGVLGLLGFIVFVTGSLVGLNRVRGDLATAALCVVAARFAHGLFDIYWSGGTTTLPWIVAGMALASPLVLREPALQRGLPELQTARST